MILPVAVSCSAGDPGSGAAASATKRPDSVRIVSAAESTAAARDEWNKAEVIKRLSEAGLVVSDVHRPARDPTLAMKGEQLTVSGSELRLFIYPDAAARARESAALDTTSIHAGVPAPLPERLRYVIANNMIAIFVTPNERLAERIGDVLSARHRGAP
ncbi:MAG: hypothetical protein M3081_12105 [Gemmatimonadota bacterium]|nr:hypothetical protein [Gemmatimonadota bacterium]